MSTSSAAGKLHFHRGWKALAVRRAPCAPLSPQRPQNPDSCWRVQVTWSHRCDPPGTKPVQTFHFTRTQIGVFVVVCCSLLCPKAGVSPLCWDKMIPFWWIQCIVSHGLEQVILDRHGHTEKLLVFNIYLQTAAGLMGQAEERCYHSFCSERLFPFIAVV